MNIFNIGSDYPSSIGNGFAAENYIINGGLKGMGATYLNALRTLEKSLISAGLTSLLEVLRVQTNQSARADRLNFLNPWMEEAAFYATYQNDDPTKHTLQGVLALQAVSTYKIKPDLTNFHLHAWNTTPEDTAVDGRVLLGAGSGTSGATNNFMIALSRFRNAAVSGYVGPHAASISIGLVDEAIKTGVGLLSLSKVGNSYKLYLNGVVIQAATYATGAMVSSGITTMYEGRGYASGVATMSAAKTAFLGYGATLWTDANELAFFNALNTFKTAITPQP